MSENMQDTGSGLGGNWEAATEPTLENLEDTLDELKRCYQKGEIHKMPGPIEKARSQVQHLQDSDELSDGDETISGLSHFEKAEDLMANREEIHDRIRELATIRYSPLPDGSQADPDDWEIRWWMIEDGVLHYHVDHPDFNFKPEGV